MARDPKYDILFEPIQIGPKTMKNRFYQIPHCNGFGSEKPLSQAYFRAHEGRGRLGRLLHRVLLDLARVGRHAPRLGPALGRRRRHATSPSCATCSTSTARWPPRELWYGGPHAPCMESRCVPRGPSQIPSDFEYLTYPKEMDKDDIRQVQQLYVDAAKRAREAGFDIVYVYGSHSYLPQQFLTPYYNRRTDEYGGSFENRARFWRETIEQVKEAVGDDCAIARSHVDRHVHGRDRIAGSSATACRSWSYVDDMVDLWDINVGDIAEWGENAGAVALLRGESRGAAALAGQGRSSSTNKPVARRRALHEPGHDDRGDQRGPVRHHRRLPPVDLGSVPARRRSTRAGSTTSASASAATICISRWEIGGPPMICTQNATAGEEYRRGWHPEKFDPAENADKDVLVVGAGPAGMECAMVLGKRGMSARAPRRGRQNRRLGWDHSTAGSRSCPGLGEWARVVNYRKIQLDKLRNVEFIPDTTLDADGVIEYGAEIVVIATGGTGPPTGSTAATHDADSRAPTRRSAWQLTPEQIMRRRQAGPGQARADRSTTTATSWASRSPRSWRAKARRSR